MSRSVEISNINWANFSRNFLIFLFAAIVVPIGFVLYHSIDNPKTIPTDISSDIDWSKPPCNPDELSSNWKETTNPNMINRREFLYKETGLKIAFEKRVPGENGFRAIDHWHRYNPTSTNKLDFYLDKNGYPVGKGSKPSHIEPKCH